MIPTKYNGQNTVIVRINRDEKAHIDFKTNEGVKDFILIPEASEDGRIAQPTTGVVVSSSVDFIKSGYYVIFHHNATNKNWFIDKDIYRIPEQMIYAYSEKIPTDIEEIIPIYPVCFVERIFDEPSLSEGGIYMPFRKKHNKEMKVVKVPNNEYGIKGGDIVMIYEKSDYELNFTLGGFFRKIIKINIEEDIMCIIEKDEGK